MDHGHTAVVRLLTQHLHLAQVLDIVEALAVAEGEGQDLVEVSPLANPPVCRLQDYNKAKYAAKLREKVLTFLKTASSAQTCIIALMP